MNTFEISPDGSIVAHDGPLPEGVYSTLRTYERDSVILLHQHRARLEESARLQGHTTGVEDGRLRAGLGAVLKITSYPETRLRVTFAPPRLFVTAAPFEPPAPTLYARGAVCITLPLHRYVPHAKDTRFLPRAAAAYRTLPEDVHEALLVDDVGALLEGLSSNFFALRRGVLYTEGARVLEGVTRSLVLQEAAAEVVAQAQDAAATGNEPNITSVCLEPVRLAEVGNLEEAFITSTSRGVMPVVTIDEYTIADGRPGPVTRRLGQRLQERVARERERL